MASLRLPPLLYQLKQPPATCPPCHYGPCKAGNKYWKKPGSVAVSLKKMTPSMVQTQPLTKPRPNLSQQWRMEKPTRDNRTYVRQDKLSWKKQLTQEQKLWPIPLPKAVKRTTMKDFSGFLSRLGHYTLNQEWQIKQHKRSCSKHGSSKKKILL